MDVIVIGKRSFNRGDKPEVVYCGQSRDEAKAAIQATAGKFQSLYYVNPEPFQKLTAPEPAVEAAAPESTLEPEESPKKRKK